MCLFSGKGGIRVCDNAVVGSNGWGLSDGICQAHFAFYKTQLANNVNFGVQTSFLDDYVRILALMNDKVTFPQMLQALSTDMENSYAHVHTKGLWLDDSEDRFRYREGGRTSVRISRLLSYSEGYCWFPDTHANFAGLLDGVSFGWGLTVGLMPKDPGAGAAHGDFSHRLQWHVVMRVITRDFETPIRAGWNHSPLELFTALGSGNPWNAGIWGFLFDNNSARQNSLGVNPSMEYSNPDSVNYLASKRTPGMLGRVLTTRWEKRKGQIAQGNDHLIRFLRRQGNDRIFAIWNHCNPLNKVCNGIEVTNVLYHWRKLLGRPNQTPQWLDYMTKFNTLALPLNYNFSESLRLVANNLNHPTIAPVVDFYRYLNQRVAYQYWEEVIELKPLKGATTITTPQANVQGNLRAMDGIFVDESVQLGNINARVASSKTSFNRSKFVKSYVGIVRIAKDE